MAGPPDNLLPKRYEVLRQLGSGGTSVVYHARDRETGTEVAVKLLAKERLGDRFAQEAQRLSQLSHPNVVGFYEVGKHDGRDYIVMEYLAGGDLASYLTGKTTDQALRIFVPICAGLGYLHSKGIVHRDVKPANILLDIHGVPKLTDLGSARQVDRKTRITKAGAILGTYAYLAPEQIQSGDAGPAADLYSLGVCLFEALTGRRPFTVKNEFKLMKAHLEEPPPALSKLRPDLPESVDRLVASLLEKKAENRPTTAEVVAAMLERCRSHLKEQARNPSEPTDPDTLIEGLSEAQRSVLLAIAYLGERASFSQVCAISPFAEDRTDAHLDALVQTQLLTCHQRDVFELNFPRKIVLARITPRVRDLFETRLTSAGAASPHSSGMTTVGLTQTGSTETPEPAPKPKSRSSPATKPRRRGLRRAAVALAAVAVAGLGVGWSRSAELVVASMPEQASVIVDGQWRGKTPLRLRGLMPGSHAVRVVMDGYISEVRDIDLSPMRPFPIDVTLTESRGRLAVENVPAGAQVTINGAIYDPKDLTDLSLLSGKTRVKVVNEGFRPYFQEVTIDPGEKAHLKVEMSPILGQLECLSVPEGASVLLDGKEVGQTPLSLNSVSFGSHRVEIRKAGFAPFQQTVRIDDETPEQIRAELSPTQAELTVTSTPPGAEIFVDGKSRGTTPLTLTGLNASQTKISSQLAGHKESQQSLELAAGKSTTLHFVLVKGKGVVISEATPVVVPSSQQAPATQEASASPTPAISPAPSASATP